MLNRIIDFTLEYQWLVLIGIAVLLAAGGYALYTIPVEAFPDLTNNQVVIVTEAPSLPPTEIEQLVTYPIERAMLGLPNKEEIRSLSKLGLSMVTVVFDDSVPMYFGRQLVNEPLLLAQYGLTLHDVAIRVQENNSNFGGGYIEHAAEQFTLLGSGRATRPEDFGNIVIASHEGTPVLLRDVAEIRIGAAPPSGAALRQGESVSGTVIMLKGENGKQLIERVKERIASMRLPSGIKIVPFYDQSFVIDGTIHTVEKNLFEGFILVTVVLLLFLGNIRAAIITASIIPFSMLISFLGMRLFGISANLMSLGAIDFGMI